MTKSEFYLYICPFIVLFFALAIQSQTDDGKPREKIVTQKDRGVSKEDVWIFLDNKLIGVKEKMK